MAFNRAPEVPPVLVATRLASRRGEQALFSDLDLSIGEGEVLAVVGTSGSGKTTLLRMLAGLDEHQPGTLSLDGKHFSDWGAPAWRLEVAYVHARAPIFEQTPRHTWADLTQLVSWRGRRLGDPVDEARALGLASSKLDQRWASLSDGERLRVALALVLARQPKLLLLDEPTRALDEESAALVEGRLAGQTAIWVTHDRSRATRVGHAVLELS